MMATRKTSEEVRMTFAKGEGCFAGVGNFEFIR
jgi:hypothetical protein